MKMFISIKGMLNIFVSFAFWIWIWIWINLVMSIFLHVFLVWRTFIYITNPMSWPSAQSYCRAHYTDLASVSNMTENQKVDQLVPAGVKVWIGLFRVSWKWTDGSNSLFRYWKTNEPNNCGNEACGAANMKDYGKWGDWSCDWKKEFVCYTGKPWFRYSLGLYPQYKAP
uniref:C-type lectin domain-containing protein n=1 Tax=Amphilophus citrinellus TaxID=61819 RepID=A0A3Q0T5Z3_AMPCI